MKALTYAGLPTSARFGPLGLDVVLDPTMRPDTYRVEARQVVDFADDWVVLVLGAVRGAIQARIEQRGATRLIQDDDDWCDDLMEAMGDVLVAEGDREQLHRALTRLGAVAAEWTIAIHRDRTEPKEGRP